MGTTIRISEKQHKLLQYIKELSNEKWNRHPNYNPSYKDAIEFLAEETNLKDVISKETTKILENKPEKAGQLAETGFLDVDKLLEIAENSDSIDRNKLAQSIRDNDNCEQNPKVRRVIPPDENKDTENSNKEDLGQEKDSKDPLGEAMEDLGEKFADEILNN